MFEVLTTEEFDKDFGRLGRGIKERVAKAIEQLRLNPFSGKPLGYEFFREKKIGKYRIYCLIYEQRLIVFVVAMSDKKDQQATSDKVRMLMPFYREAIEKRFSV